MIFFFKIDIVKWNELTTTNKKLEQRIVTKYLNARRLTEIDIKNLKEIFFFLPFRFKFGFRPKATKYKFSLRERIKIINFSWE